MCARLDDVAQKVMQRLRPAEPVPMQDFETMRKQANLRVFLQLVNLNEERMVWADRMQRHLENTFKATATKTVSDLTSKHIRWMQDYLEAKGPAGKSLRREGEEGGGPT